MKHEQSEISKTLNSMKVEIDLPDKVAGFDFNIDDRIEFLDIYKIYLKNDYEKMV